MVCFGTILDILGISNTIDRLDGHNMVLVTEIERLNMARTRVSANFKEYKS
jgi:hypothetical protein